MAVTASRKLARKVITEVRERDGYAREILDAAFQRSNLSSEERAFAAVLTYGVVQSRGTLEEILERSLTAGTKLEPAIKDALLIPVYELVFLKKPAHVAVSQGVDLVRALQERAGGLANAVLRKVVDDIETFPWGDPKQDVEVLARLTAHPKWIAQRFVEEWGYERARAMMEANNGPAPMYIATNFALANDAQLEEALAKDHAKPVAVTKGHLGEELVGCFRAGDPQGAMRGKALSLGLGVVCDASAQEIVMLSAPKPKDQFLEVGSGRGTKTVLFQGHAQRGGDTADIYALDNHDFKTKILTGRMKELGVRDVVPLTTDARDLSRIPSLPPAFDGVFIDAPCSGLGTLRRHPEKRWALTPKDVRSMATLGSVLLEQAASCVKIGGYLVYSTCTVLREENQDVIEAFLASAAGNGFILDKTVFNGSNSSDSGSMSEGYFGSLPTVDGPDGHFAAKLIRTK